MRSEETLKLLKKKGNEGVSSSDIAEKFGFAFPGSASKLISTLRHAGHNIPYDKERGVYTLVKEETPPSKVKAEVVPKVEDTGVEDSSHEATFFKISGKKDKIREFLLRSGSKGATPLELSKYSGVSLKNVCSHIHSLRKDGSKIALVEGRYIIRANRKNPVYDKGTESLPISDIPVEIEELLGDKRLVRNIGKLRASDLPSYMDLLKKIVYYTKCALALIETDELLETLTIGDGK